MLDSYGVLCLLPVVTIITIAIITRKTFVSMFLGTLVGFLILANGNPITGFDKLLDSIYKVLMNKNTIWILLVCGFFGSLIALVEKSGGALGFSALAKKFARNRTSSLVVTWILGIIIFVDEYLNALAVGAAMRKITDDYRVSREMLAYIINSVGATVCVLVPFSSWSAFMAGQMEANGVTVAGSATTAYIYSIPFMIYAWLATIIVPFFIFKIIPIWGPLKNAERRTFKTGMVLSESSQKNINETINAETGNIKYRAVNFIIPMLVLTIVTVVWQDILNGVFAGIATCFIMYIPQKVIAFSEFFDTVIKGLTEMFPVLILIITAFALQKANNELGLTEFIIKHSLSFLHPGMLPFVTFIVVSIIAFATGTFWSLAAIMFPIITPLALSLDVNVYLAFGAKMTAAMKNLMGVVWDRQFYHRKGLDQCIADFPLYRKPTLNIVDAYRVLVNNGPRYKPGSKIITPKMQFISTDIVAIDAICLAQSKAWGLVRGNVPYVEMAYDNHLGKMDISKLNIKKISA